MERISAAGGRTHGMDTIHNQRNVPVPSCAHAAKIDRRTPMEEAFQARIGVLKEPGSYGLVKNNEVQDAQILSPDYSRSLIRAPARRQRRRCIPPWAGVPRASITQAAGESGEPEG